MHTVERYLDAISEIDRTERLLRKLVDTVVRVGCTLPRDWATLSIVGVERPVVPSVPTDKKGVTLSASQWPTAERIANVLERLHRAHDVAEAAWGDVAPELQGKLAPPPKRFAEC